MKTPDLFVLVDDDPLCNFIAKRIIKVHYPASSIVDFLDPLKGLAYMQQLANEQEPKEAVLLLDINMPKMNAWEFLEAYSAANLSDRENITLMLLSSSIDQRDLHRAEAYTAVKTYLTKPLVPSVLINAVEGYLPIRVD